MKFKAHLILLFGLISTQAYSQTQGCIYNRKTGEKIQVILSDEILISLNNHHANVTLNRNQKVHPNEEGDFCFPMYTKESIGVAAFYYSSQASLFLKEIGFKREALFPLDIEVDYTHRNLALVPGGRTLWAPATFTRTKRYSLLPEGYAQLSYQMETYILFSSDRISQLGLQPVVQEIALMFSSLVSGLTTYGSFPLEHIPGILNLEDKKGFSQISSDPFRYVLSHILWETGKKLPSQKKNLEIVHKAFLKLVNTYYFEDITSLPVEISSRELVKNYLEIIGRKYPDLYSNILNILIEKGY